MVACAKAGPQASAPHPSRGFSPDPDVQGISCPSEVAGPLERACQRDPVCGCALYGRALLDDDRRSAEALRILDDACHRGALDACDDGLLQASLCGLARDQGLPPRRLCDLLATEGRLPPPEPRVAPPLPLETVVLISTFEGCFVAAAPLAGTAFCFDPDRWFVRAPGKPWDQRPAVWLGRRGETSVACDELTLSLDGTKVVVSMGGVMADLVRMAPADERRAFLDAAAMGKVEDLCARARACVDAVARKLPPVESDAPYVDVFTSALACEDARREAVAVLKPPPPECR